MNLNNGSRKHVRCAATLVEYSLMLALIAVVLIVGVSLLASSLKQSYTQVNDSVEAAVASSVP